MPPVGFFKALYWIRTHYCSRRAAADLRLRPRDHCDWHTLISTQHYLLAMSAGRHFRCFRSCEVPHLLNSCLQVKTAVI
jgi:hypothetical protein